MMVSRQRVRILRTLAQAIPARPVIAQLCLVQRFGLIMIRYLAIAQVAITDQSLQARMPIISTRTQNARLVTVQRPGCQQYLIIRPSLRPVLVVMMVSPARAKIQVIFSVALSVKPAIVLCSSSLRSKWITRKFWAVAPVVTMVQLRWASLRVI